MNAMNRCHNQLIAAQKDGIQPFNYQLILSITASGGGAAADPSATNQRRAIEL